MIFIVYDRNRKKPKPSAEASAETSAETEIRWHQIFRPKVLNQNLEILLLKTRYLTIFESKIFFKIFFEIVEKWRNLWKMQIATEHWYFHMYFQYSTSECKFFVALQLFLATEFRPKVSAEIRHFSPKVSVSAESQNPTFGRTLLAAAKLLKSNHFVTPS